MWRGDEDFSSRPGKSVLLCISAEKGFCIGSHKKRSFTFECVTALLNIKLSLCLVNYAPRHKDHS
jgi:CDGSH-type Zn-finger protein